MVEVAGIEPANSYAHITLRIS